MSMVTIFRIISDIFNVIGVAILTYGALGSASTFALSQLGRPSIRAKYDINEARRFIVERTILSLDFFVGADIIHTVIELTFTDLGLLAGIVIIRITLAYFLSRELREKLPD